MPFPEPIIDAEYGKIAVEIAGVGEEYQTISDNFSPSPDVQPCPTDRSTENHADLKQDVGSHHRDVKNRNFSSEHESAHER